VKVSETALDGVLLIEPVRHEDARGFLVETFKEGPYRGARAFGPFVQDNLSRSLRHVLRGLHFQRRQAKLVTVVRGLIFDVAVDIRPDSGTFGRWVGSELSENNHQQLYIPEGFAHGFCVLSDEADVWYKTTDVYRPEEEGGIRWDDPAIGIDWPVEEPVVSERDRHHPALAEVDRSRLITAREISEL
jgi:dTDP-4-dehydrorhamnose 3,5-epimerase